MPPTRFEEARDYAFADQTLALRERAGLTQRELAELLGGSERAIGGWEAGESYPGTHRLKQLIALLVERVIRLGTADAAVSRPLGRGDDTADGARRAVVEARRARDGRWHDVRSGDESVFGCDPSARV